jgi:hypothetical protein
MRAPVCCVALAKIVTNVTDIAPRRMDHGDQEPFVDRGARARRRYV